MLIKDYERYLNLSKVLNSTFGAEGVGNKPFNTQSIKFDILDDGILKCRFLMIVNFGSDSVFREMRNRYKNEAISILEASLKRIAEEYKVRFPGSDPIKLSAVENSFGEDVEIINYSIHNANRKAYYRFGCLVEVE